ncbi:MAG: hypothetical protein IJU71_10645, partial [Selenomonadaceae bacterium]|nr:hypothetical protein [Selenomonadaceae bacterium]
MLNDKFFRVLTYHGTKIFVDGRKLFHGIEHRGIPLNVELTDRGAEFFLLDGDHRQYISNIRSDMTVELTDQPTVIAQQTNDDGSISIVRNGKFLSARNESDAFRFVGAPKAWEKFFPTKANLVDADNSATLTTLHNTTVMLDETSRLCHKSAFDRRQSERMIYARASEKTIRLFVLDNNAIKFIRSVDAGGKVILTDKPTEFAIESNPLDQSIAIKCNAMYLSAVLDTERFTLARSNREWEHFTLDALEHFDLDKTNVVLVSPDAETSDAARARLDLDVINIKAVVDSGDADENTVLNNIDSLWLINGRDDQTRAIAERLQRRRGDVLPRGNVIDLSRKMLVTQPWLDNFNSALETDYEFIALGDARTVALDLAMINGHKAINLAADRQDIRQSYLIARRIFDRNRSIKFVLIGLTFESMSVAVDEHFSKRGLDCRYIFADGGSTFDEKIFRSIFKDETELPSPDPEPVIDHIDEPIELNDRSLRQLEELIALCIEHGARPIGVLLPTLDQPVERTDMLRRVLQYMERAFDFILIDLSMAPTSGNVLNCQLHRRGLLPLDEMRLLNYERLHGLRSALSVDDYNDMMARIFDASIQTIKRKDRIKIGFVVYDPAMWCGDLLYKLFADNERYETTLFLCLRMDQTSSLIEEVYRKGIALFKSKGLNVVGINQHNVRIPKQDVLIYLTPYFDHLPRPFRPPRLTAETLLTYIPYGFRTTYWNISDFKINFIAWKLFMDSKTLVQFMARNRSVDGDRLVYSGLPKMDSVLLSRQQNAQSDWKMTQPDAVKIIWAPHWSIEGFRYHRLATFQWNFEFMYEYAAAHPETSWIV